jgi:hypothetical protein
MRNKIFLVLMTLLTIAYLAIMAIKLTRPVEVTVKVAAMETPVTLTVVTKTVKVDTIVIETPVVTVTPMPTPIVTPIPKHTYHIEECVAGFPTISFDMASKAHEYVQNRYLLAKVAHCEAGVDSMEGKLSVLCVVMNRVEHWDTDLYGGHTIKGVVYHKLKCNKHHLFSCIDDKELWAEEPGKDDYEAADKILNGYRPFGKEYLYYYNPNACNGTKGIKYDLQIGMHKFGTE